MNAVNFQLRKKDDKSAELVIYDVIGNGLFSGISAKDVIDQLKAMGDVDEINVRINSPGGSGFDGIAIYNALTRHSAAIVVDIDSVAASAAALVAMAADKGKLRIASNARMMIHNASAYADGDKNDLNRMVERLRSLDDVQATTFAGRMKVNKGEILSLMEDETWYDADEAVKIGLADEVTGELKIAACASDLYCKFKHVPADLAAQLKSGDHEMTEQEIQAKIASELKAQLDPLKAEHTSAIEQMKATHAAEIAALKGGNPPKKDDEPTMQEQLASERTRVKELHALAANAGVVDQPTIDRWVDKNLSVIEAKAEIGDIAIKAGTLVKGDASGGGDQATKEKAADRAARAEYQQHPKLHASLGYADEDAYAKFRAPQMLADVK